MTERSEPSLQYRVMKAAEEMLAGMQKYGTDTSTTAIYDATGDYIVSLEKRPAGTRASRLAALQELSDLDQELGLIEGDSA